VQVFIETCRDQFDLIFLDPPFGQGLIQPVCRQLDSAGLLVGYGKIYIEAERALELSGLPENWHMLKHKVAGDVGYHLYQNR
jgi:16S rRNA (guanine966-N2)-methyltransferase